jgi:hypothetical protein
MMKKTVSKSIVIGKNNNDNRKELTELEQLYVNSLDEKERKAYEIAKSHLGTTFNIIRSNGFIEWKKTLS